MNIPFKLIAPSEQPHPNINWRRPGSDLYQDKDSHSKTNIDDDHDQGNYFYDDHEDCPALSYDELESTVQGLGYDEKHHLSCFFFFPQNAFIKRSVLLSWNLSFWVDQELGALVKKRLVQEVYKKSKMAVAGYRMYPFVHSNLRSNISWFKEFPPSEFYAGHSHNVDDKYIYHSAQDFDRFIPTGDQKQVLHLGKWNNSTEQHIEVIDPELFFKDMSKLTSLRIVSLRGISMIKQLPKFITELKWLHFLDLKACHDLEVNPSSIANLKPTLVHLDISECYFLDHMPKALATLYQLKVLKGFVVGESEEESLCTLEDLVNLQQLEKLNIYTRMKGFPNNSQFTTLQKFEKLHTLTISWGGCSGLNSENRDGHPSISKTTGARMKKMLTQKEAVIEDHETRSFSIEKLDLQCVPVTVTPHWLKPANFQNLKKLYIRGGSFFDLGQYSKEPKWDVEILRLKHLNKLNIGWSELHQFFPKLICLEKVNCPNLVQFPCDDSGFWKKDEQC